MACYNKPLERSFSCAPCRFFAAGGSSLSAALYCSCVVDCLAHQRSRRRQPPFCSGFSDTVFCQYRRTHFFDHLPGTVCDILQLVHSPAIRTAAVTRTKRGFFRFLFPGSNSNPGLSFLLTVRGFFTALYLSDFSLISPSSVISRGIITDLV